MDLGSRLANLSLAEIASMLNTKQQEVLLASISVAARFIQQLQAEEQQQQSQQPQLQPLHLSTSSNQHQSSPHQAHLNANNSLPSAQPNSASLDAAANQQTPAARGLHRSFDLTTTTDLSATAASYLRNSRSQPTDDEDELDDDDDGSQLLSEADGDPDADGDDFHDDHDDLLDDDLDQQFSEGDRSSQFDDQSSTTTPLHHHQSSIHSHHTHPHHNTQHQRHTQHNAAGRHNRHANSHTSSSNNNNNNHSNHRLATNTTTTHGTEADRETLLTIREFAEELKERRKAIRLSQKGAAQSLRAFTNGVQPCTDAIIYHFENLQLEPDRAIQLIPLLRDWLEWAERHRLSSKQLPMMSAVTKVPRERKRKVVLFNEKAKQHLEDAFLKNNHPDRYQLEVISKDLGIPTRSIRKWFTNRRQRKRFAEKFSPII